MKALLSQTSPALCPSGNFQRQASLQFGSRGAHKAAMPKHVGKGGSSQLSTSRSWSLPPPQCPSGAALVAFSSCLPGSTPWLLLSRGAPPLLTALRPKRLARDTCPSRQAGSRQAASTCRLRAGDQRLLLLPRQRPPRLHGLHPAAATSPKSTLPKRCPGRHLPVGLPCPKGTPWSGPAGNDGTRVLQQTFGKGANVMGLMSWEGWDRQCWTASSAGLHPRQASEGPKEPPAAEAANQLPSPSAAHPEGQRLPPPSQQGPWRCRHHNR